MLVQPDPESAQAGPDTLAPLCDEVEFAELVDELVAEDAPRLFAVLQEYGERADGRIAAWGMAFPDHADVVGVDHGFTSAAAITRRRNAGVPPPSPCQCPHRVARSRSCEPRQSMRHQGTPISGVREHGAARRRVVRPSR